MKNILITGANGKIAKAVTARILNDNNLFLFSRDIDSLIKNYSYDKNIKVYSYDELDKFNEKIDIILHCAFARNNDKSQLDNSYKLSKKVFELAKVADCQRFINISSQAVYNMREDKCWSENDNPSPFDDYGIIKLACEKILAQTLPPDKYINIRLTALAGCNYPQHILYKLICNAIKNKEIKIVGGKQNFAFMNFYDAINAIMLLFNLNLKPQYNIYNLGNNEQYNILEIVSKIKNILYKQYKTEIKIILEEKDITLNVNMTSNRFMEEFNWRPEYTLEDTINEIIKMESILICNKG